MLKKVIFQMMTEFNKKIFYDIKTEENIVNIKN